MKDEWFYQVMGEVFGPVTAAELKLKASKKTFSRDTLVRRGEGEWVTAENVKGLFPDAQQFVGPSISVPKNDELAELREQNERLYKMLNSAIASTLEVQREQKQVLDSIHSQVKRIFFHLFVLPALLFFAWLFLSLYFSGR